MIMYNSYKICYSISKLEECLMIIMNWRRICILGLISILLGFGLLGSLMGDWRGLWGVLGAGWGRGGLRGFWGGRTIGGLCRGW